MNENQYLEAPFSFISEKASNNFILLVTATQTETKNLHQIIKPIDDRGFIYKIHKNNLTYYLAKIGFYNAVHVQTGMGSVSRGASLSTLKDAINDLTPKAVIMLGIAFGLFKKKQSIGDVLVSENILPYEYARKGESTIHRGGAAPASGLLANRFKNVIDWRYILPNGKTAKIIVSDILSGEKLIDNLEFRDSLIREFPTAVGGEMEGAGLYVACESKAHWILIKGICDFADGNKSKNKDEFQSTAIKSALSASMLLFNSSFSFDGLDITPVKVESKASKSNIIPIPNKDVLFDIYKKDLEKYYIPRNLDYTFNNKIKINSIWLYGPSGAGKTVLAFRNLLHNNKKLYHINLAGCISSDINFFINEILYEMTVMLQGNFVIPESNSFSSVTKQIYKLLLDHLSNKEAYIILEEIPLSEKGEFVEFTNKFIQLINGKNQYQKLDNVRFILSSIDNPSVHVKSYQLKVLQYLKFIEVGYWTNSEIIELDKLIQKNLSITIDKQLTDKIIELSKNCPRFIKSFYRNLLNLDETDFNSINIALRETTQEFYYL